MSKMNIAAADAFFKIFGMKREEVEMHWINVKDRLPDTPPIGQYRNYICANPTQVRSFVCGYSVRGFNDDKVTHWMPLPNPPKGDELTHNVDKSERTRCK